MSRLVDASASIGVPHIMIVASCLRWTRLPRWAPRNASELVLNDVREFRGQTAMSFNNLTSQ